MIVRANKVTSKFRCVMLSELLRMRSERTTTTRQFPTKPTIPTTGIAIPSIQNLESSMIWNQFLQSSSEVTISSKHSLSARADDSFFTSNETLRT